MQISKVIVDDKIYAQHQLRIDIVEINIMTMKNCPSIMSLSTNFNISVIYVHSLPQIHNIS